MEPRIEIDLESDANAPQSVAEAPPKNYPMFAAFSLAAAAAAKKRKVREEGGILSDQSAASPATDEFEGTPPTKNPMQVKNPVGRPRKYPVQVIEAGDIELNINQAE